MVRISCAMITRNAESTLERALQSVREHIDELVILDTGSTDGTCEIIARYADCAAGFKWRDDFAAARNAALDLCTGDWIVWLDADDELINGGALRAAIELSPPDLGMLMVRYAVGTDRNGHPTMEFWRERAVRAGTCRWVGRAHEVLLPHAHQRQVRVETPYVLHHGHGDDRGSLERNVKLLEMDLRDDPSNTRTLFYLGRDLVTLGNLDRGRLFLRQYMTLASWDDEKYMAQSLIAFCHRQQGQYQKAYDADLELLRINPTWPMAYYQLAQDCYHLERWYWGAALCAMGRTLPRPQTNLFVSERALEYDWIIYQVVCLNRIGMVEEAYELTKRALEIEPEAPMHRANAERFAAHFAALEGQRGEVAASDEILADPADAGDPLPAVLGHQGV